MCFSAFCCVFSVIVCAFLHFLCFFNAFSDAACHSQQRFALCGGNFKLFLFMLRFDKVMFKFTIRPEVDNPF